MSIQITRTACTYLPAAIADYMRDIALTDPERYVSQKRVVSVFAGWNTTAVRATLHHLYTQHTLERRTNISGVRFYRWVLK